MCGRVSLSITNPDEIADQLGAEFAAGSRDKYRPRWNVGPQQWHWIARSLKAGEVGGRLRLLEPARWGWMRVVGPPKAPGEKPVEKLIINMVGETAFDKPMFRKALRERRCVVPASGFYEWTGDKKDRRPIHFQRSDGQLLYLAGVYDDSHDDEPARYSVLTTTANQFMSPIHNRMPVILDLSQVDSWLAAPMKELITPAPENFLVGAPASKLVNTVGNEGASLLLVETAPQSTLL